MSKYATYNTADLPQASYLHASGIPLINIEKISDIKSEFCFERTEAIEALLMDFASGREVLLIPSRLLASHKHLKSLLWTHR